MAGLEWEAGKSQLYTLELDTKSHTGTGAPPITLRLRAQLRVSPRNDQLLVNLEQPKFVNAAGGVDERAAQLVESLSKPFVLEFADDGLLVASHQSAVVEAPVEGFRRHLASVLQLTDHPPEPTWKGLEWDATGLAEVGYKKVDDASDTYRWTKSGFRKVVRNVGENRSGVDVSKYTPSVRDASGTTKLDSKGLVSVEREETLSVPLTDKVELLTTTRLVLRRVGFEAPPSDSAWNDVLSGSKRVPVDQLASGAGRDLIEQARRGDYDLAQAITELEQLDSQPDQSTASQRAPLFHALIGLFRANPADVVEAEKRIRAGAKVRDTLMDALAMASSVEAVKALGELAFDEKLPEPLRVRAASSLIRASRPGPEALALTIRMCDDPQLREHGLLGLGSFVRKLGEQGSPDVKRGVAVLERSLTEAKPPGRRVTVLLAIANSGVSALYERVIGDQDAKDSALRDAAIQAIRLMDRPEVEPRLLSILSRESSADVLSALHALARREAQKKATVDKVEQVALEHPNADVRREAVIVLAAWSKRWPEVVPTIRKIADSDPERRVRDVATARSKE